MASIYSSIKCHYSKTYRILHKPDSMISGMDDLNTPFISLNKALQDDKRIEYHRDYLSNISAAIR